MARIWFVVSVLLGVALLLVVATVLQRQHEMVEVPEARGPSQASAKETPLVVPAQRRVYPYSVIKGGAQSAAELRGHVERDPVVAAHFADFSIDKARLETLQKPRVAHVSYRIGDEVYWTRRKVVVAAGEKVLTDGVMFARARCGNLLSETPGPISANEPPAGVLDTPIGETLFDLIDPGRQAPTPPPAGGSPGRNPGGDGTPQVGGAGQAGGGGTSATVGSVAREFVSQGVQGGEQRGGTIAEGIGNAPSPPGDTVEGSGPSAGSSGAPPSSQPLTAGTPGSESGGGTGPAPGGTATPPQGAGGAPDGSGSVAVRTVPEPATALLVAAGASGLVAARWLRRATTGKG